MQNVVLAGRVWEFGHGHICAVVEHCHLREPRSEHFDHQRWDVVLDLLLIEIHWACFVKNNCNTVKTLNTLG